MRKSLRIGGVCLLGIASVGVGVRAEDQGVIVRCSKPYDAMEAAIRDLGGEVTYRYENLSAVAASVPKERVPELFALAGVGKAYKDSVVPDPAPVSSLGTSAGRGVGIATVQPERVELLEGAALEAALQALPNDYLFNNALIGASALHAHGKLGQGVIVAVIDSGTANAPVVPGTADDVIGGESFVPSDPVASATSRLNGAHGTWVGTVISSNVVFGFSNTSPLVQSLKLHSPGSILGPCPDPPQAAVCGIPLIGVAPKAKIYAMKVFASTGGGSPESRIIAAFDRAITLRRNFNNGVPSVPVSGDGSENDPYVYDSLNLQVLNLSLGGPTLFPASDFEDEITGEALKQGIVIVASAGNDGFAAITGGSPGTARAVLTVGAASTPPHERVLRDLQFGLGIGALYRPFSLIQSAFFSSRGPTADGRWDPELTANGFATLAQGTCQGNPLCMAGLSLAPLSLVSGTSFSAPTVAGGAALVRQSLPWAAASQIRKALALSANPFLLGDHSGRIDQGRGFLDIPAAVKLLQQNPNLSGGLENSPGLDGVRSNLAVLGLQAIQFDKDAFGAKVQDLRPGQVAQFYVPVDERTDLLQVSLSNIAPELPPSQQNQLFGDDIFLNVTEAPTSFNTGTVFAFVNSGASFAVPDPQTGIARVAVQGDWTNAGRISAELLIQRVRGPKGPPHKQGDVGQNDLIPVPFEVPTGTSELVVELSWKRHWGAYPANDIDLLLLDPNGAPNFFGATLASPERVVVNSPTPGTWTALVNGFTVNCGDAGPSDPTDRFTLKVKLDGVYLP